MGIIHDLTGKRFERLLVLEHKGANKHGVSIWLCRCDCGNQKIVTSLSLKSGGTKSCGCYRAEAMKKGRDSLHASHRTHGRSRTPEHCIWQNMIYRCYTPTCPGYRRYGGRGIKVCRRWKESFEAFIQDMGPRPSAAHTVNRINNNGHYTPKNCRWATKKEQANNRRNSRPLKYKGQRKNLCEWAEIFGLDKATLHGRLRRGWSVKKALETPPRQKN